MDLLFFGAGLWWMNLPKEVLLPIRRFTSVCGWRICASVRSFQEHLLRALLYIHIYASDFYSVTRVAFRVNIWSVHAFVRSEAMSWMLLTASPECVYEYVEDCCICFCLVFGVNRLRWVEQRKCFVSAFTEPGDVINTIVHKQLKCFYCLWLNNPSVSWNNFISFWSEWVQVDLQRSCYCFCLHRRLKDTVGLFNCKWPWIMTQKNRPDGDKKHVYDPFNIQEMTLHIWNLTSFAAACPALLLDTLHEPAVIRENMANSVFRNPIGTYNQLTIHSRFL